MILTWLNLVFVALLLAGTVYFYLASRRLRKKIVWEDSEKTEQHFTLLSISVPKNNDRTPQAAEQMFAALHGIYREGAKTQPQISFEIVSKNKIIKFFVHCPSGLKDFLISQIFAQYPNVEINEIDPENDYVEGMLGKQIAATELELRKESPYPIKTFPNFEVDPLSAITGVLSSVNAQEEVWVQTIVRPIGDDWQQDGEKVIKEIKEPVAKNSFVGVIVRELRELMVEMLRGLVLGPPAESAKKEDKPKELSGPIQQAVKGIEEKITKLGYEANIRVLTAAPDEHSARAKLEQVVGAYKQFNTLNQNSFTFKEITNDKQAWQLFKHRAFGSATMIFNITELASLYHFPSETVATPTISWAGSKKGEPPPNLPVVGSVPSDELTILAATNFRNEVKKFGIKKADRRLHMYIIGKTGTGKSTLLENMVIDDIREGRGVAVVDPHGTLVQHLLEFIPEHRVEEVVYFNPADYKHPIGFNLLENVDPQQKNIVASGVVGILEKIFGEVSWGPRLEYILRNVILALLEYPGSTFLGIMRLLTDNAYRRMVLNEVKDPVIRDFFINEYEKYEPRFRTEAIAPIQNKVGQFLSASTIRNIIGQPKSTIDIREIMDNGKILLADLSVGKIGEDNSALLGAMLITKIQLAAMGRVDVAEDNRRDFYLYVDEFQNFATNSFATILSESRKYRLNLAMANQYTAQMPESVSDAVFGNVGTIISFRVGAHDADVLVKEFEPIFDANDLVNLDNYQIYLKMAIDGVTAPAFSASTLPPQQDKSDLAERVIEESRKRFSRPIEEVEDYITEWSSPIDLSNNETQGAEGSAESKVRAVSSEKGSEAKKDESKQPSYQLPKDARVEILKDRFDRPWYATIVEAGETSDKKQTDQPGSGGEEAAEDHLITWHEAEDLGAKMENTQPKKQSHDGILPIKELE